MKLLPYGPILTEGENSLLALAGDVASQFSKLPQLHPADVDDVAFHVHAIQNIILARAAYMRTDRF